MSTATTFAHRNPSSEPVPAPYPFDRRQSERHAIAGQVTIQRCDHDPRVYQHPVCSLNLLDISDGGLAATSDVPLELDEMVTVYFPPHGLDCGFDLPGHILRCRPDEQGYRIVICFDLCHAA